MMTDHEQIRELLARRAELSPDEETLVRAHIENCADCRATAGEYARQSSMLGAMPTVPAPPALRAGVLAAIAQHPFPWWRRVRLGMIAFPGAVALIAIVAVLAYAHRPQAGNNKALSTSAHAAAPVATATAPPRLTAIRPHPGGADGSRAGGTRYAGKGAVKAATPAAAPPAASLQSGSVALGPPSSSSSFPSGAQSVSPVLPTTRPAPATATPREVSQSRHSRSRPTAPSTVVKGFAPIKVGGSAPSPTPVPANPSAVSPAPTQVGVPTVMVSAPLRPTPTTTPTPGPGGVASPAAISLTPPIQSVQIATPTATAQPPPIGPVPTSTP